MEQINGCTQVAGHTTSDPPKVCHFTPKLTLFFTQVSDMTLCSCLAVHTAAWDTILPALKLTPQVGQSKKLDVRDDLRFGSWFLTILSPNTESEEVTRRLVPKLEKFKGKNFGQGLIGSELLPFLTSGMHEYFISE